MGISVEGRDVVKKLNVRMLDMEEVAYRSFWEE